jgi:thiaminase (transcriptional activator TenA)
MNWSEQAWVNTEPLYKDILNLPFNQELLEGELDIEKFKFYLGQDAHYLLAFSKTLSTISGRMQIPEQVLAFSEFATGAVVVERALHESYFQELGVQETIKPSPTCLLYTNYISNQAAYEDVAVAVAAVLPCFWIYKKVGDHIYKNQNESKNNPYKRWIDTYAGEEFEAIVHRAISIADQLAKTCSPFQRSRMLDAFEMASKLEWMFWESAYRMEKWPI